MGIYDLFGSPFYIVIVCIGIFAALTLLSRSWRAKKIGKWCIIVTVFFIWFSIVDYIILPSCGLAPSSADYSGLKLLLYILPIGIYIWKGLA